MERTQNENAFLRVIKYLLPWKGDRVSEVIRKIIFLAAAIALIIILSTLATEHFTRSDMNKKDKALAEQFHGAAAGTDVSDPTINIEIPDANKPADNKPAEESPYTEYPPRKVLEQFNSLLETNPETIGWLTIQGTNESFAWIDYPVLQTTDNDKYLNYDFYGQKRKWGALFADYHDKITPTSQPANIVVYGHNMASGEYFGRLPYYFNYARSQSDHMDISFYKGHPTVDFTTLYGSATYKIFATIMLNTDEEAGEVFPYHLKHNFKSRADFNEYVAEILDRSTFYNPDVNVMYGDELLTLSTCMLGSGYGNTEMRFVVFARKTREGESPKVDVSKAYANPNPKFYEYYYQANNYKWEGRKWDKNLLVGYEE